MSTSRLNIWIQAARPKTLPAALSPVLIGTAMSFSSSKFHLLSALMAAFGALWIQIGTNFANDYFDNKKGTDSGDRLGPTRVSQAGLVTDTSMKWAIVFAFAMATLSGVYLIYRGGWPILLIGILSILFGILYTAGPRPLSYTGLADIFVLLFFGPVAVGGTYYVQSLEITWPVIVAGLATGFLSVAILTVNNLRDLDRDKLAGKNTLPVRFGVRFARTEYLSSIAIASIVPLIIYFVWGGHPYSLLGMLLLPLSLRMIKKVMTMDNDSRLNEVLAGTGKLLLIYSILFSVGWLL